MDAARAVSEDLDLYVARPREEPLDEDLAAPEAHRRLLAAAVEGLRERLRRLHHGLPAPPAAVGRLEQQREPHRALLQEGLRLLRRAAAGAALEDRQPGGHRAFAVSEELAKTAVLSLLGAAAGAALLVCLLDVLARRLYASMKRDNRFQLDEWLQDTAPSGKVCAKAVVMNRWFVGGHVPSSVPLPLAQKESPFVRGLRVTSRLAQAAADADAAAPQALTAWPANSVVVGTIRMGFGHHRIAYAATSWGLKRGAPTYFHDFLAIDSPEATLIKDQDKMYSRASRVASEWGGCVERIWGSFTKSQGDATLLRVSYQMAEHLKPLLLGIPKDTPIIASHSFVGLAAVACGFKKVINLVIDNHPQWFCVVPGALNLVQGPSNYHNFLRMGVPPSEIRLAGHWIPQSLVDNIPADCEARKQRARQMAPLRLVVPVGGAGAQRKFVTGFVCALGDRVKAGAVNLLLNAGDHPHMKTAFEEALRKSGLDYHLVDSNDGVDWFVESLLKGGQPPKAVTLFAFGDYFPAVATTDKLCRVADVLCCKPSELAFYPVPKLMIRRVGDHEAYSALRASELGDGTLEARELEDAMAYVKVYEQPGRPLLVQQNDSIVKNHSIGLYDGCKNAVEAALEK
mmetsp:Transcript_117153/g.309500  ORF Transcript_117153/g.309500 Transcript_117153/m.309500 type:complete len:627 (+) Transcript_117153:75-1955(+)